MLFQWLIKSDAASVLFIALVAKVIGIIGCFPLSSSNGIKPVDTCLELLYVNSAAGKYSFQVSCF